MTAPLRSQNSILQSLSVEERSELLIYGKEVQLHPGIFLQTAGSTIEHVFFLYSGLCSLIVVIDGGTAEAGFVSRTGAVGTLYNRARPVSFSRAVVVAGGAAFRLPRVSLEHMLQRSSTLAHAVHQNNIQIAERAQQIAGCNLLHHLDARLCRWLLQTYEASANATVSITQDVLSQMLGVNRQRLNEALRDLQDRKAVTNHRAEIRIISSRILSLAACRCTQAPDESECTVGDTSSVLSEPGRCEEGTDSVSGNAHSR